MNRRRATTRRFITRIRDRMLLRLVVTLVLFASLTGTAVAFWTAAGTGTGAGDADTAVALTIAPAAPTSVLRPGGTASVSMTVSNSNLVPVLLESLTLDTAQGTSGFAVDAGHAACSTAVLGFADQDNGGSGWTIPASGSAGVEVAGALSMTAAAATACQGATFTVYVKDGP